MSALSGLIFRYPVAADIEAVAGDMRPGDVREVMASHGLGPLDALRSSVLGSPRFCFSATKERETLCIFGVASRPTSSIGSPWMLGSTVLDRHRALMAAGSRSVVAEMRRGFAYLENHVHADNVASVRWLRSCGFTVEDPIVWGHAGELFHRFWAKGL